MVEEDAEAMAMLQASRITRKELEASQPHLTSKILHLHRAYTPSDTVDLDLKGSACIALWVLALQPVLPHAPAFAFQPDFWRQRDSATAPTVTATGEHLADIEASRTEDAKRYDFLDGSGPATCAKSSQGR
ncbi:hypothetical protein V8E36_007776 [Tilletia maclaganii]